jgi:hypothetical protein
MSSSVREFFLGKSEFKTSDEIIATVRQHKDFDANSENLETAEAMLIFQTSKQQTWLVVTSLRLYCVLDDLEKSSTRVQWSIPIETIADDQGQFKITIQTRDKTPRTGLLDIGDRRSWLFSKKLFASEPIEAKIRDLVTHQLGVHA